MMKVYIFILKAQNKWGILPAIRLVLCVWIYFKSANFTFYHRSRRGLQKPFFSVHNAYFMILKTERGLFDEFVPREISQVSSSLYFLTWLSIRETRESIIETQELILKCFKNRDASDCQLNFEWYCTMGRTGLFLCLDWNAP